MKKYMFLPITLLVSILVHLLILMFIPGFNIAFDKKMSETIEVELVKPKVKKPQRVKEIVDTKKPAKKEKTAVEEKQLISPEKVMQDTEVDVSQNMPSVNLPKFKDEPEISVQKPGLENLVSTTGSKREEKVNVNSEIASAKSSITSPEGGDNLGSAQAGNNFFEIQSASNTNRSLLKPYPEKPTFSLESNTTVTLSFHVDQNGNTYGITPVTRSDENIEEIAIDYVNSLKFEAVSYKKPDNVQIKFYFNVE